jgi:trehalose-phosphatase
MRNQTRMAVKKQDVNDLPSALSEIDSHLKGRRPAVFLDYDGCLSPIVKDPDKAYLSPEMKQTLHNLAAVSSVAVVSGRDRANVKKLVALDDLYYAGSHGFDISGPGNMHIEPGGAKDALPELDKAEKQLNTALGNIEGVFVERKKYAIAVHYRNVAPENVDAVKQKTDEALNQYPALKKGLGKKIIELKPNMDWHKGKAVLWLMQKLDLNKPNIVPIYIGDDITDEDAFAEIQDSGIGIIVGEHEDQTAASYKLESVEEVREFLDKLTNLIKHQKDARMENNI